MAENSSSPYKSSTPQERFAKQLDRDLSRNSRRLSQSTIRALITNDTAQWANAIYNQKLAQNNANNSSAQQTSSATFATTQTSQTSAPIDIGGSMTSGGNAGSANASSDTISEGEFPEGTQLGQILYWSGASWATLSPPAGSKLHVLASFGSIPFWSQTQDC